VKKADKVVGAVMADPQSGPPSWIDFVCVDSADEIANRVKKSGGKVLVEPRDASTNGRMAVFQDPTTAVFAGVATRHQAGRRRRQRGVDDVLERAHHDRRREGDDVLQEPVRLDRRDGEGHQWSLHAAQEGRRDGRRADAGDSRDEADAAYWLIYFAVDDCDASAAKAEQLSGKVMMKPTDIPDVGRFAVITDPQGAWFAIMQPKSPQQASRA
jgi:predicted enzyme related to lactoylglutathione lyase